MRRTGSNLKFGQNPVKEVSIIMLELTPKILIQIPERAKDILLELFNRLDSKNPDNKEDAASIEENLEGLKTGIIYIINSIEEKKYSEAYQNLLDVLELQYYLFAKIRKKMDNEKTES